MGIELIVTYIISAGRSDQIICFRGGSTAQPPVKHCEVHTWTPAPGPPVERFTKGGHQSSHLEMVSMMIMSYKSLFFWSLDAFFF